MLAIVYVFDCVLCICIITEWVAGACRFEKSLNVPLEIYRGLYENFRSVRMGYAPLVQSYSRCCYLCVGGRKGGRTNGTMEQPPGSQGSFLLACKLFFWLCWVCLIVLEALALLAIPIRLAPKVYLIALLAVATFLNGSSYLLCCVYVWFLSELSNLPQINQLPYNRHVPIQTPEYQKLSNAAKRNASTFLFVTVQFSAVIFLSFQLLLQPGESSNLGFFQLLCYLMVLVVGFVTFSVLFQYSRIFLRRIVSSWQERSANEIYRDYRAFDKGSFVGSYDRVLLYEDAYAKVMQSEGVDRIDLLNIFLALMSLLVNAATFVVSIL